MKQLNKYPMVGLSADWIYRTWLVDGDYEKGTVIFEDEEEENTFELLSFVVDPITEEKDVTLICSGTLETVLNNPIFTL